MAYVYPLDVEDLVSRVKQRGADFTTYLGLEEECARTRCSPHSPGISPPRGSRSMPRANGTAASTWGYRTSAEQTLAGAEVRAVADGEVVFVDDSVRSEQDFDLGRVIIRHASPDGDDFFALYYHLDECV